MELLEIELTNIIMEHLLRYGETSINICFVDKKAYVEHSPEVPDEYDFFCENPESLLSGNIQMPGFFSLISFSADKSNGRLGINLESVFRDEAGRPLASDEFAEKADMLDEFVSVFSRKINQYTEQAKTSWRVVMCRCLEDDINCNVKEYKNMLDGRIKDSLFKEQHLSDHDIPKEILNMLYAKAERESSSCKEMISKFRK